MMRTLMFAASLMAVTACSSDDPTGGACTSGSDCGETEACDTVAHVCVADALTIDPSDFVVQSSIWWTSTSEPTLRGTFEGDATTVIQVRAGTQSRLATQQGSAWNAKLAPGSITTSSTPVTISLSDRSGRRVEAVRTLGVDTAPPAISLGASTVRDERGDTIEFSSGEPVHTHDGVPIDLAGAGCPSIYKYSYLMSATDPAFGRQASNNPLAWNVSIADMKVDAEHSAYRVRDAAGGVVLDWTPLDEVSDDRYRIELVRDGEHGIAALGTTEGQFTLDVRARDWAGLETVASYCWTQHPLAAPLEITQLDRAQDADGLFSMTLAADSPISTLAGIGLGPAVASQRIVQYTAEPIVVKLSPIAPYATVSRTYVDEYVEIEDLGIVACQSSFDCNQEVLADPPDSTITASTTNQSWNAMLFDEDTGEMLLQYIGQDLVIPPRAPNAKPHAYAMKLTLGQVSALRPAQSMYPSELAIGGVGYTGLAPSELVTRCIAEPTASCHGPICTDLCPAKKYGRMVALDAVSLDFAPMSVDFKTSAAPSVAVTAPHNVPPTTFAVGALGWDGGNDDLPGPH